MESGRLTVLAAVALLAPACAAYTHVPLTSNHVVAGRREKNRLTGVHLNFLKDGAAPVGSARAKEATMIKWLQDNGAQLSDKSGWGRAAHPLKVESDTFEDFEVSGRGLLARNEIQQGGQMLAIPSSVIMTREVAAKVLGPRVVSPDLNEYLALALLLMHEKARGSDSFWAPYIELLPTTEDVGQTWTWEEDDLKLLTGSSVLDATASLKAKLEREYATLVEDILIPNNFDTSDEAGGFSWTAFEWAMSMLFSRAIDLREVGTLALVPYADLINHSPYAQSYFFYNQIPLSNVREVCLYADRAYARNDQVLISYGQKSNSELILLYGFVVDRNLFDEVDLTIGLDSDDARYVEKADFLEKQRLQPRMQFPLLIDRYSNELMQYLRLCCITARDGPLDSYKYAERISVTNERSALQALRDGCMRALAAYPESEEEDVALMEKSSLFAALPRNARMAIKLRRNEKRILLKTIQTCDTALETLGRIGAAAS